MNCKQCGTELFTKREDARFCNGNCKQKHYKRRKKILDLIAQCERAIKNEENIIEHWNGVLVEASGKLKKRIASIELEKEKLKLDLIEYNETLAFSDKALFLFLKTHFEKDADKFDHYLSIFRYGTRDEKFNLLNQYRQHFKEQIESFKDRLNLLEIESLIKGLQSLNKDKSEEEKEVEARLKKSRHTLSELKQELDKLSEIDLERIPVIPSYKHPTKLKAVSSAKAYTGREIADINFNAVQLNGALGRFCGKMERNKCAVALTGDSGAGKSHFSYALADDFVDQNLNVGYFSLESGIMY
ncbi:MAG: ATP-binding protein [Flavobacteriales bacterium]|nr:ATP-binding protein [Flavobacteriales bacterium]